MSILHTEDVHLIDYLRVVYKRRLFLVVVILAALGGTVWSTYRQTPVYGSTTRILLDNQETIADFPGVQTRQYLRLDTEMHIMRSREVAEHAILSKLRPGIDRKDAEFEPQVQQLMSSTGVEVVRNTLIVEMRTLADDPEKARSWSNAMAESYVEVNFDAKKDANAAAAVAIKEQIDETQRELELAERRLMDFKAEYLIVSDRSKLEEQLRSQGAGTAAKVEASLKKVELENKARALERWFKSNDFSLAVPPDLAPNTLVNDLYSQIVKKRVEHRALLEKYRDSHPKVQAITAELDTLQRNFDQEVEQTITGLRKSAEAWSTISGAHESRMQGETVQFLKANERDWQYNVLQRNVDVKDEIYKTLLKRLSEINVTTSLVKNNVRIIERAKALSIPLRPNWRFNLLVGLVFGSGVAVAGVFFLEYLDKTLKTPDDVSRYLALPVLAVIPLARAELLRAPYEAPRLREGEAPGAEGGAAA